jgi:hypothetical protein
MEAGLDDLLRRQSGIVGRGQFQELGLSRAAWRWRIERHWRLVLPCVACCHPGPLTCRQRLIAAQLYAGRPSMITSLAAAAWHGVLAAADHPRVHLCVPPQRMSRTSGFALVRRTTRPDPAWERGPLVIASPARAVADAARDAPTMDAAREIVIEAVQRGVVPVQALRHDLLDDVGVAVQVHSRRHHGGSLDWERTVMADGVPAEYGVTVVAVTPARIASDPGMVTRRVERVYLTAQCRPRPPVIALRSGHGLLT